MPNDCGCAGSSSSPPGTTSPTVNAPVGSTTAFGGAARIPRSGCVPAPCPQPPVSDAEERAPYCPTWANSLTASAFGRILLSISGCLYTLKSKCSGFLRYDPATEQVTVENPPFVSSDPKATNFGFLAKVVPTPTIICVDGVDTCETEIRQELAAQVLGESSCGRLMIGYPPLCGDVAPADSADLQKQVHVDYLEAPLHEDVGCPAQVRFLVQYPGTRGTGGNQVACEQFAWMRRLKLRGSDWNFIPSGSPLESTAKQVVVVQVAGGDDDDPCFELRVLEGANAGIPDGTANCQGLIWRNNGTETEGWYAEDLGARDYLLDSPQALSFGVNTNLSSYEAFKAKSCKIQAIVAIQEFVAVTGSGAGGSFTFSGNGKIIAVGYTAIAGGGWLFNAEAYLPLPTNNITFTRALSIVGSANVSSNAYSLLGYRIA